MNKVESIHFTRENITSLPKILQKMISRSYEALPVFCFPEVIEKIPISLTYCFIYLLGSAILTGCGFYLYFHYMFKAKLKKKFFKSISKEEFNDGYVENQQNIIRARNDKGLLPRMSSVEHDTEMYKISLFHGDQS